MIKMLKGPNGITIELDSRQVFADDPGAGTPALVHVGKYSATYWCALDTGELDGGEYMLTDRQSAWLDEQIDAVSDFIEAHS